MILLHVLPLTSHISHLYLSFLHHHIANMSTDKELYKLELLSLVSRVSQELFNHTKMQDKKLAEFVIAVRPPAINPS